MNGFCDGLIDNVEKVASFKNTVPYLWPKRNGWKTVPFGAAHTSIARIRKYPHYLSQIRLRDHNVLAIWYELSEKRPLESNVKKLWPLINPKTSDPVVSTERIPIPNTENGENKLYSIILLINSQLRVTHGALLEN